MIRNRRWWLWVVAVSLVLTAMMLFLAFRFVLPKPSETPPRSLYTIGVWEGQVAVFERNQSFPKQVYDMPVSGLPHELRQQVMDGVPVYSEEELSVLLEDYTG